MGTTTYPEENAYQVFISQLNISIANEQNSQFSKTLNCCSIFLLNWSHSWLLMEAIAMPTRHRRTLYITLMFRVIIWKKHWIFLLRFSYVHSSLNRPLLVRLMRWTAKTLKTCKWMDGVATSWWNRLQKLIIHLPNSLREISRLFSMGLKQWVLIPAISYWTFMISFTLPISWRCVSMGRRASRH